jgi:thiol:disulfide interchange protein
MKIALPRCALLLLAGALCSIPARAAAPATAASPAAVEWNENYAQALARAKLEHKLVLLDFTGSDWCVWCHRLNDEILSQDAFAAYARTNLILVELDYPRKKAQAAALKAQNATLYKQFAVEGYPTIVLVNGDGKEVGRTGYMEGGPQTFVRELKRFAAATPAG